RILNNSCRNMIYSQVTSFDDFSRIEAISTFQTPSQALQHLADACPRSLIDARDGQWERGQIHPNPFPAGLWREFAGFSCGPWVFSRARSDETMRCRFRTLPPLHRLSPATLRRG